MKTVRVVAAVIHKDGKIFATQRGYGAYKDYWEFPGGKIEAGETPEEALIREIREELATTIQVERFLTTVEYDYPEFHLSMDCFLCSIVGDTPKLLEHESARWLTMDHLYDVNWLPADLIVIEKLREVNDMEGRMMDLQERLEEARTLAEHLFQSKTFSFQGLTPSMIDPLPGVYAIYDRDIGATLYVGRTKNIRRRLYTNHLMGPAVNARLKKYLVEDPNRPDIPDMIAAKKYLQDHCDFQYIRVEETETRGKIEGLLSYLLNVVYIHEEH